MRVGFSGKPAGAPGAAATMYVANDNRFWAEHWSSLQRDDLVPLRSALDPVAIPQLLPHMLICDLAEPGVVRIRLMGTRIVQSFGFDPTGRDYLELVAPDRRRSAQEGFLVPAGHPCGMRVLGENRYASGRTVAVESVGFPFRRDDGAGMQMVFVGARIDAADGHWPNLGPTTGFHVFEREYIDIGAGIP